jgi:hypothetical protein
MKHIHHDDSFRSSVKQTHLKSHHPTASTEDFDDSGPEAETIQPPENSREAGMLSNQQRPELRQASERNKQFLNPIQSAWPMPSA